MLDPSTMGVKLSQSGSWQHRCMGAGLQHNFGKEWGPVLWSEMTSLPPNPVFSTTATNLAKDDKDRKRKATDEAKVKRRQSKYSRVDNLTAARKTYSRHDGEDEPDDVCDHRYYRLRTRDWKWAY